MTGLSVAQFNELESDMEPRMVEAEQKRLLRPKRKRTQGGGRNRELEMGDQLLMSVIWLRRYPTHEVLGYLFGVSDSTVSRIKERLLPLLAASGRDAMRMPDPGRKQRRTLDELLGETPAHRCFSYALFNRSQGYIDGFITVRKEQRQRGGFYWTAYRRQGRRLRKRYLGASATLTHARLQEAAHHLCARDGPSPSTTSRSSSPI